MRRFLRIVVEETLARPAADLKEYPLVEVFDRPPSFDPRLDPIVQVEAGRLRAKLERYYDTYGRTDAIVIELAKGGYLPRCPCGRGARTALVRGRRE
jgi:hypothetical protein